MYYPGLEGKNVLLVGGHSNLGQHVTKLFAEAGANIVIAARDIERAEHIAAEARSFKKGQVVVVETDATNWQALERAVNRTLEFGELDVLYHGILWGSHGPQFLEQAPQLWDTVYERNFKSVLMAYKAALPIMIAQRNGCFITMSSVFGRRPVPNAGVDGALRRGLIYLAQCFALEVAKYGVRINVVAPGPTPPEEDLNSLSANSVFRGYMKDAGAFESLLKKLADEIPLGRLGKPENVAHAVLYLASPVTGGYQTGQVVGVDGGWWMPG
jgi:NAD(P)-dependent dehydrogenase (short-subunit alcohol dehydrogenase family)